MFNVAASELTRTPPREICLHLSPARKRFVHHGDQITAFSPLCGRKNTEKSRMERKVLKSTLETKTSPPFDKESGQTALSLRFLKRNMAALPTNFKVGFEHLDCKDYDPRSKRQRNELKKSPESICQNNQRSEIALNCWGVILGCSLRRK